MNDFMSWKIVKVHGKSWSLKVPKNTTHVISFAIVNTLILFYDVFG